MSVIRPRRYPKQSENLQRLADCLKRIHIGTLRNEREKNAGLNYRIRVLIADDHPIVRKMVRATLQNQPNVEVCGEATNGAEAVEQARRSTPDVVVLNISMPVLNGLEAARAIRTELPRSGIVILSTHADKKFVEEAKKVGVKV